MSTSRRAVTVSLFLVIAFGMLPAAVLAGEERAANRPAVANWTVKTEQFHPTTVQVIANAKRLQTQVDTVPPANATSFIPVTPCRVVDTRTANGTYGGPALATNSTRTFNIASSGCGIPSGAAAYSLNFTALSPADNGFLTAYPSGTTRPLAATLSYLAGGPAFNDSGIVPGSGDAIDVYTSASTQLVVDVNGYFLPQAQQIYPFVFSGTSNVSISFGGLGAASHMMVEIFGSGFRTAVNGAGMIGFNVDVNGTGAVPAARVYTNETLSHKSMVPQPLTYILTTTSPSLSITALTGTQIDSSDFLSVKITFF